MLGDVSVKKKWRTAEPYLWILPSVILMAIFIIVPIFYVFKMAVSDVSKTGKIRGFAGFENFSSVLSDASFGMVMKNTLIWTVAVVGLSTILGFMLALILNNKFRGRKIARAIVVFPWATTLVIQASVWNFIINTDYGTLNTLLLRLGIIHQAINWTPTPAAYFAWEIACGIFVTIPFVTFTVLSGLQSIDNSFYEAATVDGANYWQKLFKITIPLLKPIILVTAIMSTNGTLQLFDESVNLTRGGPANMTITMSHYIYNTMFTKNPNFGYAAAMSFVILVMVAVLAAIQMKVGDKR